MMHTHLTDDQLVALCLEDVPPPQAALCDWCQERRMEIAGLLEEMAERSVPGAIEYRLLSVRSSRAPRNTKLMSTVTPMNRIASAMSAPAS